VYLIKPKVIAHAPPPPPPSPPHQQHQPGHHSSRGMPRTTTTTRQQGNTDGRHIKKEPGPPEAPAEPREGEQCRGTEARTSNTQKSSGPGCDQAEASTHAPAGAAEVQSGMNEAQARSGQSSAPAAAEPAAPEAKHVAPSGSCSAIGGPVPQADSKGSLPSRQEAGQAAGPQDMEWSDA
jgi:hypothetical protein